MLVAADISANKGQSGPLWDCQVACCMLPNGRSQGARTAATCMAGQRPALGSGLIPPESARPAGVMGFDSSGGFYLQHSTPRYPDDPVKGAHKSSGEYTSDVPVRTAQEHNCALCYQDMYSQRQLLYMGQQYHERKTPLHGTPPPTKPARPLPASRHSLRSTTGSCRVSSTTQGSRRRSLSSGSPTSACLWTQNNLNTVAQVVAGEGVIVFGSDMAGISKPAGREGHH